MVAISEAKGDRFEFSGQGMWEKFAHNVRNYPDTVAVACTHQPAGHLNLPNAELDDDTYQQNPYLRIRYKDFGNAIDRVCNALLARGAGPGKPIFTFMPNLVEFSISLWAAFKIGAVIVPLNPKNLLNREEADHMVKVALSWNPSDSAIVLAGDNVTAQGIECLDMPQHLTKILVSPEKREGWLTFAELLHTAPTSHPQNPDFETLLGKDGRLIMFTSGTTSLPKGVAHSADWFFAYILEQRNVASSHAPGDVVCIVTPNNHAIGLIWFFFTHGTGSTIVYPGSAFNPQVMMDTLVRESCTHVGLVPTMVHGLLAAKAGGGGKPTSLKSIALGGSMVSPEIISHCLNDLGAANVENLWGMTEGCVTYSGGVPASTQIDGDRVSVGYAAPNSKIRVCGPNSKTPLPRGVAGELHCSGPTVTKSYIGKRTEDFYVGDDGEDWFMTGDQVTLDETGRVFMTGRYKEMIIRGGENIAPAAVEAVLMKVPQIAASQVQIVGAKDSIAGEVPVAVYMGKRDLQLAQMIQQTALSKIGPAYVPDQVIALQDLGLDDYPRTMAGKVAKNKLAASVQEFRDKENQPATPVTDSDELMKVVKRIWNRTLGYNIDENAPFASFADSITVMRTRDMIAKETGRQISLSDMVEANTIAGQIQLLQQQQPNDQVQHPKVRKAQRQDPVTAKDVVLFRDCPDAFVTGKAYIEKLLSTYDLGWNDVADIVPVYDFGSMLNQAGIMDTWSFTIAMMTEAKGVNEARQALYKTLSNNPLFASFFVWDHEAFHTDSALHIVMKHTDKFLGQRVNDFGSVKAVDDVKRLVQNYPVKNAGVIPGPLFDVGMVLVEETQTIAIVMVVHHAIMDASCSLLFIDDLNDAFGAKTLPIHTDYKVWADSYYSLSKSLDAQLAVRWHVDRLRGASTHRKAFFIDTKGPRAHEDPINTSFEVPSILKLRQVHPSVSAPVVLKSAFALTSTYRSQYTHAMFSNLQASRESFPFIPSALTTLPGHDYSAANVAGPTIEMVINLIEIQPKETVLSFLNRMQTDQDNLTKNAAAPLRDIVKQLGDEDGPLVLETLQTINFNWVPGMGSQAIKKYENIENLAVIVKPEMAFALNAGLGGEKGSTMMVDLLGNVMTQAQHRDIAKLIERITIWLVDERNWEREVGAYKECLV